MIAATTISASSVAGLGCARMRSRTVSARRPTHTGIAAARQLIEMSSDMIETIDFARGVVERRQQDRAEKGERGGKRKQLEEISRPEREGVHQRGHPHVLAATQRQHGAEHGEPEEQQRGEFVRPDQRTVERVARDDADEQDGDLGRHQQRGADLQRQAEGAIQARGKITWEGGAHRHAFACRHSLASPPGCGR